MPAPACSNTLPKRRNPDGNKTAQEGTNTRCGRTEKDRLLTRLPFPQGRGPHHLQSPYSPQLSRPSLRTAPVQNDMYTRREVYISDPAPYRQTLTCTAKDVFANDQAPAPDNNATVRNQDTPSLFVLLPSCSEQDEYRPASEPYRARPFAVSWAAMTGHPLIRPFVHGTAGKVPLGIINAYGPPPHRTDYPMNIHEAVTPKRQRQIIKRKTGRRNAAGRAATGSLQKKKSPQECIPRRLMENCRIVIRTLSGSVSLRAHATHCLPRLQARARPA